MLKRVLMAAAGLVALAVLGAAIGLGWAHVAIRRERPPLPATSAVSELSPPTGPVRALWINTASQPMPRSAVLDRSLDPHPGARYVMSHPSFVLEWADGRILLIDMGMTRDGAIEFGRMTETLGGAEPMQPLQSASERLDAARQRVQAVVFTHLHVDHVGGIRELCDGLGRKLDVFMNPAQAERPNFTTRSALQIVREAPCVRLRLMEEGAQGLFSVPGFPGLKVVAAAGHTPGGQMILATVGRDGTGRAHAFLGDIVNNIDGIKHDIPKPLLYRWLVVPEDGERLSDLRRFAWALAQERDAVLLVSHDQLDLQRALAAW